MKGLTLFAVCVGVVFSTQYPLPEGTVRAVRDAGIPTLEVAINTAIEAVNSAYDDFKPINDSCAATYEQTRAACGLCVEGACTARAKIVCDPEWYERLLMETMLFFEGDFPDFFTQDIPLAANVVGGGIVTGAVVIGDGFVDFGNIVGDAFTSDGLVDIGVGINTGLTDFGNIIGNGIIDLGDSFSDLGNTIGDLFGKRQVVPEGQEEPSCPDLMNNAESACMYYANPAVCPSCTFNPNTDCPGYEMAVARINEANTDAAWLKKATDQTYNILQMTYNPALFDPATGGFTGVQVRAHLFGFTLDLTIAQPINPYVPEVAGPVIATAAINAFKLA